MHLPEFLQAKKIFSEYLHPAFMMKMILGEFGDVLLKGQKAMPAKLTQSGFRFMFPTIDAALKDLMKR